MLTVSNLAKQFGISRTTILYYEKVGLLTPAYRSNNSYRWYGESELEQLETILAYRSFGIPVAEIKLLLEDNNPELHELCLRKQFKNLEREIQEFRRQQRAILKLLEHSEFLEEKMISKERWVEIMQASGLNEQDMQNWHKQFEKLEPEAHQEFLVSLGIEEKEIAEIRSWSRE